MNNEFKSEKIPPTAPPPYVEAFQGGASQPPQYGFQMPQPGYPAPVNHPAYPPTMHPPEHQYGALHPPHPPQTVQPVSTTQQTVVILGGCPSCRVGVLEDNYTCCGILCAICFFPLGILCCLAMKEKKCTSCGATF